MTGIQRAMALSLSLASPAWPRQQFGLAKRARSLGARYLMVSAAAIVLSGCSPVYMVRSNSDGNSLHLRLKRFLDVQGFQRIGLSERATGDIGCGGSAPDRTTFQKEWRDSGIFTTYHWVWIHEFSCNGVWHAAILSSRNADRQATDLRDALLTEFASEVASGMLHVDTRYRFAFE
jgi:hypothetical protein